ncbi:penicillin acylase family protein [Caulobacter sp. LARHSG274]
MPIAKLLLLATAWAALAGPAAAPDGADLARWRASAARVRIVRDDWGIAHVHGRSDADAVFGMVYAQAEDDFNRIEANYLTALGRTAEAPEAASDEAAIWRDLRMKLFVDPVDLQARYAASPAWLKALMDAWADGLNFYLASHPAVKPKVITRFEPWMALSFTEGSIGGDVERISPGELEAFYGQPSALAARETRARELAAATAFQEPTGSNGFAIAPAITQDRHALLLINPHTSFFFRSELQVSSDAGLDAYGAATWGQFFIYQGFNAHAGWMHTSSTVDVVDEFAETVSRQGGRLVYRYGAEQRPVTARTIAVSYRTADGRLASRTFTTYRTHHGPIVRAQDGKWIAFAMMYRPVEALKQSYLRTKTRDYTSFLKVAALQANSSNNTLFADDQGEIAYLHPQFIPRRDDRFDYTKPVDGADPATDWKGLHALNESPHLKNPANGWLMNTNNWPYSMAGPYSPRQADYPRYMDSVGETPRGRHALRVLTDRKDFTLPGLVAAAYDPYLTAFADLVPALAKAYDETPDGDPLKARLGEQVAALKAWNLKWSAESTQTSLAVFWGEALWAKAAAEAKIQGVSVYSYMAERTTPAQKLAALAEASDRLTADFGGWRTPWGQINRFQRNDGAIVQTFDDAKPSIPVPFASGQWGSLASFGARRYPGTKKYYGTSGNSFVAAVEFGPRVKAVAISAGGESGDPASPHFTDQAARYAKGDLRPVYFYPDELEGHIERAYRPGEVGR